MLALQRNIKLTLVCVQGYLPTGGRAPDTVSRCSAKSLPLRSHGEQIEYASFVRAGKTLYYPVVLTGFILIYFVYIVLLIYCKNTTGTN